MGGAEAFQAPFLHDRDPVAPRQQPVTHAYIIILGASQIRLFCVAADIRGGCKGAKAAVLHFFRCCLRICDMTRAHSIGRSD